METSKRGNLAQRAWGGVSQVQSPMLKIPPELRPERSYPVDAAGVVTR